MILIVNWSCQTRYDVLPFGDSCYNRAVRSPGYFLTRCPYVPTPHAHRHLHTRPFLYEGSVDTALYVNIPSSRYSATLL